MARSSMGNLHLGKKYKYLLGIALFWEKIQISFMRDLLFEKKHKYLLVTATFSEKQRIPRVRRLLFLKKQRISFSYGCFFRKATNPMRETATNGFQRKKKGAESQHYAFFPLPIQSCVYMIDEAFMLLYFSFVSSEVR